METPLNSGDALYAVYENSVIQAYTQEAYHKSGGQVNPGTSSTNITVAIEAGEGHINGQNVSWAAEEIQLANAGVGPNGTDENQPRVDVIYATQAGALSAATGEPAAYAPDTDVNGNPLTPAPFEHWEPSPDSGSRVGGLVLALVLVKPNWTSAQDMTTSEIKQWRLGAASGERFVYGDGTDNGRVTITTENADFIAQDPSVSPRRYLWYDSSQGEFNIGTNDAVPTFRWDVDFNGWSANGLNTVEFASDAEAGLSYDSSPSGGQFDIEDRADNTRPLSLFPDRFVFRRASDWNGNALTRVGAMEIHGEIDVTDPDGPALDLTPNSDGNKAIWRQDDGGATPTTYSAFANPANGDAFAIRDMTNNKFLLQVKTGGNVVAPNGDLIDQDGQVN